MSARTWKISSCACCRRPITMLNAPSAACAQCGLVFRRAASLMALGGKFCSMRCSGEARRGKSFLGSTASTKGRVGWYLHHGWRNFVQCLIGERGARCERCGGAHRLTGHHVVDPFPLLSVELLLDPSNVEILCNGCHTEHHHAQRIPYTCRRCGRRFDGMKSHPRVYCSSVCDMADRHESEGVQPRPCLECGTPFVPSHSGVTRCSMKCGQLEANRKKIARRAEMTCEGCHKTFRVPACRARAMALNKTVSCSRACSVKVKASHAESNRLPAR